MLDPETIGARWRDHLQRVSDEEFIANIHRFSPDLALSLGGGELWQRVLQAERNLPGAPVSTRAVVVSPPGGRGSGAELERFVTALLESWGFEVGADAQRAGDRYAGADLLVYLDAIDDSSVSPQVLSLVLKQGDAGSAELRSWQPPQVWLTYRTLADLRDASASILVPLRRLAEQQALYSRAGINLVGARIRFFRELHSLSRESLAARVPGLSAERLARIEEAPDDVSNPDLLLLRRIATALNTTVAQLVESTPMDLSVVSFAPPERSVA